MDVLDTIGDLRDDIEKLKREKRQILKNLKRIDSQIGKFEEAAPGEMKGGDKGATERSRKEAVAVKMRMMQAKTVIDDQVKAMDGMLTKLCDSRKRLMDRPERTATKGNKSGSAGGRRRGEGGEGGGGESSANSDTDTDGELSSSGAPAGGLDGLRERRRKRKEKGGGKENKKKKKMMMAGASKSGVVGWTPAELGRSELEKVGEAEARIALESLWNATSSTSLKSGAAAEIAANDDGCPLYHKLLLDIEHPKDVTAQQRETYEFLKQAGHGEQIEFLSFALNPAMAKDLLPTASAFLKIHAHSFKAIGRFKRSVAFQNPHLLELFCCAAEEYHVSLLSPVLALIWIFAKIDSNRAILLRRGVVGTVVGRLKRYTDLVKRKGLDKRKGSGGGSVDEQTLCALSLVAGMCFA